MKSQDCILFSGGVKGAEAEFGRQAEASGVQEVNFTFDGHKTERTRGIRYLTSEELIKGDVSLAYVSKIMNRNYSTGPLFRKVLQSIWHQINSAEEVFVIGKILDDKTVKGGTGWGAEFAKICNKPLYVFDQEENGWFQWKNEKWEKVNAAKISRNHIAGTGTRFLNESGKAAIRDLFQSSFD